MYIYPICLMYTFTMYIYLQHLGSKLDQITLFAICYFIT